MQILAICVAYWCCAALKSKVINGHSIKVLDFSLDSDKIVDDNGSYTCTSASLEVENLPNSFTLCGAFMVEQWGDSTNSPLFLFQDEHNNLWFWVELYASNTYTEFTIQSSNAVVIVKSSSVFFPMQWTRLCFSFDSKTRKAIFVVDGDVIVERAVNVTEIPINLNLQLGSNWYLDTRPVHKNPFLEFPKMPDSFMLHFDR